ncbi:MULTISPECIES: DUF5412 family protein [Paenibacillus]|uniref:DUF5412 domain-containing protein n=1 Tax=Paenibacillus pabuli TaxID=1472 RepID=A0A855Y2A0_9BACL|nr:MULTISPECIES: DUF5412 family protein [Paenibacillus]PWW45436.1 hypothetical protein DET56_101645 [Paenibacillus pabuli]PXW11773.1 hypothetical protein DEU73_101644 [Paenibacillus taichungensis]RAI86080.1 hypothetical protein DET54_11923 [Paenibacillus pabuli]
MDQNPQATNSTMTKPRKPWIRRHPIFTTFSILILALFAAVFLYFTLRPYYSTFDRSEQGDLAYTMPSPNGEYVAEIYGVPYGGAAGGVTIWVDVKKIVASDVFTVKTIYRAEHHGANHLEWENENTLRIENRNEYSDDSITLNIDDEIYDGWGWACQSLRMKNQYMRCLAPEK